ncbi:hypothetical protein [Burkholderia cenocepacia]|jgi:hypothetical protein|uniref:hypothetical protein n=1 Tax=Burkholderia cenocepacia TaxID=95486 RepID=UPI0024B7F583|nr:hypothetical protein [Burkholderia cenocepacia]MDI9689698.1 hypothetical protein [Burkholderia cenocepacia]
MTAPVPAPKTPYICPNPPQFRVLDRLKKTELGTPGNRLCVGCFKLAYHDGVLLIENGSIINNIANLEPDAVRIVLGEEQLVIDLWMQCSSSVTLTASPEEMEAARTYFADRGIAVHSA